MTASREAMSHADMLRATAARRVAEAVAAVAVADAELHHTPLDASTRVLAPFSFSGILAKVFTFKIYYCIIKGYMRKK